MVQVYISTGIFSSDLCTYVCRSPGQYYAFRTTPHPQTPTPPPPPPHTHSLLFHISSPAVPRYVGTSDIQISDVAASEMLLHTCRDISRSVWQPLTLSFAIVPSAIAKKTLLPRLVMSRTESFMIQDHTSHCDWWLKARSWKSRVPTRTSPEGEW